MLILEQQESTAGQIESRDIQDHELVQELHDHLDALSRYTEYAVGAEGHPQLQQTWHEFQHQEEQNIRQLKKRIADSIEHGVLQSEF